LHQEISLTANVVQRIANHHLVLKAGAPLLKAVNERRVDPFANLGRQKGEGVTLLS
jgi:hypothetical protein